MPKGLRRRYQSARAPEHSGHLSCCEPEAEAQARRRQPVPPAAPSSASGRLSLPPVPPPHLFVRTAVIQDRGRPATPFYLPRLFRGPASKRSRVLRSRGWGFSVWIGKGGGHDSAHNGHESTDIVTFRDVSGKCRQPAGSSALPPETLGGGRAGAWPQPPVFTQALLPWAWPAAQEGLPEERGTWGGCADAGRAPPGRAHTATARPGAWPRSWDAEPVGGAARAARGAPRSRGGRVPGAASGSARLRARVPCAVCRVRACWCRGAQRCTHTHTRTRLYMHVRRACICSSSVRDPTS